MNEPRGRGSFKYVVVLNNPQLNAWWGREGHASARGTERGLADCNVALSTRSQKARLGDGRKGSLLLLLARNTVCL